MDTNSLLRGTKMKNEKLIEVFNKIKQNDGKNYYQNADNFEIMFEEYSSQFHGKYDGIIELMCDNQVFHQLVVLCEENPSERNTMIKTVVEQLFKISLLDKNDIETVCESFLASHFEKEEKRPDPVQPEPVKETVIEKKKSKRKNITEKDFISIFEKITEKYGVSVFANKSMLMPAFEQACTDTKLLFIFQTFMKSDGMDTLTNNIGNMNDIIFSMVQTDGISIVDATMICDAVVKFLGLKQPQNEHVYYEESETLHQEESSFKYEQPKWEEPVVETYEKAEQQSEKVEETKTNEETFEKKKNNTSFHFNKKRIQLFVGVGLIVIALISMLLGGKPYKTSTPNLYQGVTDRFAYHVNSIDFYDSKTIVHLTFENYYDDTISIHETGLEMLSGATAVENQSDSFSYGQGFQLSRNKLEPNKKTEVELKYDGFTVEPGMEVVLSFQFMYEGMTIVPELHLTTLQSRYVLE